MISFNNIENKSNNHTADNAFCINPQKVLFFV